MHYSMNDQTLVVGKIGCQTTFYGSIDDGRNRFVLVEHKTLLWLMVIIALLNVMRDRMS